MKNLTLSILLVSLLILPCSNLSAQQISRDDLAHWSLGVKGGVGWWDFTKHYNDDWTLGWNAGLVLEYSTNPIFGFGLDLGYYNYDDQDDDRELEFKSQSFDGIFFGSFNLSNLVAPSRQQPFWKAMNFYVNVGAGVGVYNYDINDERGSSDFMVTPAFLTGVNIEFNLGRSWALGVVGDYRWHTRDNIRGGGDDALHRSAKSVHTNLVLKYKFGGVTKNHVKNMTMAEFYPQQISNVVIDNSTDQETLNRLRNAENTNRTQQQQIQDLERKTAELNREINNLEREPRPNPVANLKIEPIHFNLNQKELNAANRAILDNVANILMANNNSWRSVQIKGYTDATGTQAINLNLSQRRAQLVADYLISKGVSPSRISLVQGYGETNFITGNSTAAERNMNRRVEVDIVR